MAKPTDTPMSVPPLKWAKHQPWNSFPKTYSNFQVGDVADLGATKIFPDLMDQDPKSHANDRKDVGDSSCVAPMADSELLEPELIKPP